MELSAGTRLGPYEIVRSIGAGGMGVVYRAKDTRLDRAVAIKVLPTALQGDADRLRRFEQEARTIGGLNHPNLVTLHDVGRHDGVPYLVTELLEGQSLRQRLTEGALAPRDATRFAVEIARGLAAAHGAGVVHRDIKPDNIYVTSDGRIKLLDFGIAKLRRDEQGDIGSAATLGGTAATGMGVVIGTPGYMAPEQLAGGGDVDARTDVFAFGVVLYEMLVGKRPFAADTGIEESYAVVKTAPPALPETVPAALARIIMRCLEKRREARFQAAADLAFALEALDGTAQSAAMPVPISGIGAQPATTAAATTSTVTARRSLPILPIVVVVVIAAAAVAMFAISKVFRTPRPVVMANAPRASGAWPSLVEGGPVYHRVTYHSEQKWFARFSADGKNVLYSMRVNNKYMMMRTDIAHAMPASLDLEGRLLDVSSTGQLALRRKMTDQPGGLLVTYVEGAGDVRERAENVHDATFVGDDLAIIHDYGTAMTLEFPIGNEIYRVDYKNIDLLRASRDGTMFAFAEHPIMTDSRGYIVVRDRSGRELAHSPQHSNIDGVAWSPDGKEVWMSTESGLQALDLQGHERVLLRAQLDLELRDVRADTGAILVAPRDRTVRAFLRHAGKNDDTPIDWRTCSLAAMSRDGSTLAMIAGDGVDETPAGYTIVVRRGAKTPVPMDHGFDVALVPDGGRAVLLGTATDPLRVLPTSARAGTPRTLPIAPIERLDISAKLEIAGDGEHVLALGAAKGQPPRLWSFALDGKSPPQPVGPDKIELPSGDARTRFRFAASPDGKWIALAGASGVDLVAPSGTAKLSLPAEHSETPVAFSNDSSAIYVWRSHGWPRPIVRVELAPPHKRTEIMPFDPPEKPEHVNGYVSGDGSAIAYDWLSVTSDLFVLTPP